MKTTSLTILAAAVLSLYTAGAYAADAPAPAAPAAAAASAPSGPVATVNGVAIPQSRLEFVLGRGAQQGQPAGPEQKEAIVRKLIEHEAISQEAIKRGLDKQSDVASQIELSRQQILLQAFAQDYLKSHAVTDERIRQEYDKAKAQAPDKEYKARHILVAQESEAKDLIKQLKKGAKFDKLAEKSLDGGSKSKGGALEWSPANNYVQPFADALKNLKKGETTQQPVKTQYGWHVIRLEDVRPTQFPSFEEAKPIIARGLQQQELEAALAEVVTKAKVER